MIPITDLGVDYTIVSGCTKHFFLKGLIHAVLLKEQTWINAEAVFYFI